MFAGGFLGTLARVAGAQLWFDPAFPWATLTVNMAGSFGLGYLAGSLMRRPDALLRFGIGAGVFGALTTFSTFVVEVVELAEVAGPAAGVAYAGGSVLVGASLAAIGVEWGRR